MNAFPVVNEAYKQFFDEKKGYPARSCYQVFFQFIIILASYLGTRHQNHRYILNLSKFLVMYSLSRFVGLKVQ